jgi:hypothetical protein
MEKSQEGKMNFSLYFFHSIDPIPLKFGQSSDGFKILVCNLFYHSSAKREIGLP